MVPRQLNSFIPLVPATILSSWLTLQWIDFIEEATRNTEGLPSQSLMLGIVAIPPLFIFLTLLQLFTFSHIQKTCSAGFYRTIIIGLTIFATMFIFLFPSNLLTDFFWQLTFFIFAILTSLISWLIFSRLHKS